jgi:hypothetical protein
MDKKEAYDRMLFLVNKMEAIQKLSANLTKSSVDLIAEKRALPKDDEMASILWSAKAAQVVAMYKAQLDNIQSTSYRSIKDVETHLVSPSQGKERIDRCVKLV